MQNTDFTEEASEHSSEEEKMEERINIAGLNEFPSVFNCKRAKDLQKHYSKSFTLNARTQRPQQQLSCKHCGKVFNKICRFHDHLRIHFGDTPYSCAKCGKTFVQKGNMKRHMEISSCAKAHR